MKVAGFGFRRAASIASLRDALAAAGGPQGLDALATLAHKADAPALQALAAETGLPIRAIAAEALADIDTPTRSARIMARFGTGSIAEALALAAAGAGARLLGPRACSTDAMAVAAIAHGMEGDRT
ncbi:MAG: cobalamin biosynthesis protein [Acetobacter sp.]|uniref:cobalamin biosynthesis protein n=1 Tax=Acetobacter sp. TaxID=440 RepID=UPI0039E8DA0A